MTEVYTSDVTIPDIFEPNGNGLLDNVIWLEPDGAGHWKGGIQYEANCADSIVTISECYPLAPTGIVEKESTWDKEYRGSRAFTIFSEYDCSPAGLGLSIDDIENAKNLALKGLAETASREAERVFWTGNVNNSPAVNYPNLTGISNVFADSNRILLQPGGTIITGGASGLDVVEGLGKLEETASACYNGRLFIHVPLVLVPALKSRALIERINNRWFTTNGNRVIFGNGYDSSVGPGGVANPNGHTQMYATSPVFALRSTPRVFRAVESFDRNVNTLKFIAEQTFLFGWQCCLVGVTVTTGGESAGLIDSAAEFAN